MIEMPMPQNCLLLNDVPSPERLRFLAGLSDPPYNAVKLARASGVEVELLPKGVDSNIAVAVDFEEDGTPFIQVADKIPKEQQNWLIAYALGLLTRYGQEQGPMAFYFEEDPNTVVSLYALDLLVPQNYTKDAIAAGIIKIKQLAMLFGVERNVISARLGLMGY